MTRPLVKPSLPDLVETRLREALVSGEYGEVLPGERILAEMLEVSRPTLRRALATLHADGLLERHPGSPTRIVPDAVKRRPSRASGRIVFLSPDPMHLLPPGMMHEFDMLGKLLLADGYELRFATCSAFTRNDFGKSLDAFLRTAPADAYVLHHAPPAVQRHFAKRGLPGIVMGSPAPDSGLAGVDTDFAPAARHAMGQLGRAGHSRRRIALAIPQLELEGHAAMRSGFLAAGGLETSILRHPADAEAFPAWIATRFLPLLRAPDGPTAVVTGWPRFTVALVSALSMRHGITIPDRLSVVCLADDPVFAMMIPRVCAYRRPERSFVGRLAKLLREAIKHRVPATGHVGRIAPDYVAGGTIGKASGV